MAPDAFSEQRRHGPPLTLDPTHTAGYCWRTLK